MLEFSTAAVGFCVFVSAAFLALWMFYDRRDRSLADRGRRNTAFHCIRCDRLYSAPEGSGLSSCPRCGHENARLRF